jgi:hypothetical protein
MQLPPKLHRCRRWRAGAPGQQQPQQPAHCVARIHLPTPTRPPLPSFPPWQRRQQDIKQKEAADRAKAKGGAIALTEELSKKFSKRQDALRAQEELSVLGLPAGEIYTPEVRARVCVSGAGRRAGRPGGQAGVSALARGWLAAWEQAQRLPLSQSCCALHTRAPLRRPHPCPAAPSPFAPDPQPKIIAKALAPYAGELSGAISRRARHLAAEDEKLRTAAYKTPEADSLGGAGGGVCVWGGGGRSGGECDSGGWIWTGMAICQLRHAPPCVRPTQPRPFTPLAPHARRL